MPLLEVKNLSIAVRNNILVNDVSFEVKEGEIFALVGESGSGKSLTAMSILGLLPEPGGILQKGEVLLDGKSIFDSSVGSLQKIRGEVVSVIFQEPGAALDPLMRIQKQMDSIYVYRGLKPDLERQRELLYKVGLDVDRVLGAYPHELSGGMKQRVMIAMALLLKPKLLIADEATTALDVTIQKEIVHLLLALQKEMKMSILFISHNLALVAELSHRVAVMQKGKIVEKGTIQNVIQNPQDAYTKELLQHIIGFL